MRRYHHALMMNIIYQLMKTNSKSTSVAKSTVNPGSPPSEPDLAPCLTTSTFMVKHKQLPKSRMIGKALLSGL